MKTLFFPQFDAYLRYHDFPGEEPAVIFLHGLGSASSADFPGITRHPFFNGRRCLLPDFFGFGFSDKPHNFDYSLGSHAATISRLINSLNLSQVYLFGHSMGGAIAIVLAAAHPEPISRLTLAEANLDPGVGEYSKIIAGQTEADYLSKGHADFLLDVRQKSSRATGPAAYAGALALAAPLAVYKSAVGLIRGTIPSQRNIFLALKMPRSFLFGEHSLPHPDVAFLRSAGINVFVVPAAGHSMMNDNPEGFTEALIESFTG